MNTAIDNLNPPFPLVVSRRFFHPCDIGSIWDAETADLKEMIEDKPDNMFRDVSREEVYNFVVKFLDNVLMFKVKYYNIETETDDIAPLYLYPRNDKDFSYYIVSDPKNIKEMAYQGYHELITPYLADERYAIVADYSIGLLSVVRLCESHIIEGNQDICDDEYPTLEELYYVAESDREMAKLQKTAKWVAKQAVVCLRCSEGVMENNSWVWNPLHQSDAPYFDEE